MRRKMQGAAKLKMGVVSDEETGENVTVVVFVAKFERVFRRFQRRTFGYMRKPIAYSPG